MNYPTVGEIRHRFTNAFGTSREIRRTRYRSHQRIVHSGTWRPHFNISSLPETVRMLHHLRESYEILQHVGADVESLSTDISLKCRTEVVNICCVNKHPCAYLIVQTSTQTKNLQSATLLRSSGTWMKRMPDTSMITLYLARTLTM
jgi:hypothetical protein